MTMRGRPELLRQLELMSAPDRRVLAQLWNVAPADDPSALLDAMTDPASVQQQLGRLGRAERAALERVLQAGGALPVAILEREYGPVREPARFEHPRAYLQALQAPAAPLERLYAMGLLLRGHDERGTVYRVPNDLMPLLPKPPPRDRTLHIAPAEVTPDPLPGDAADNVMLDLLVAAYAGELTALDDGALNKAGLVRLAKRLGWRADELRGIRREADWPVIAWMRSTAAEAGLIRRGSDGLLRPTAQALAWLDAPRPARAARLLAGWLAGPLDDLVVLSRLHWRGSAPYVLNHPAARRVLLELLGTLPASVWLSSEQIAAEVRRVEPDFLRRDGRFDTWLLYAGSRLVSGWENWHEVEGRLIRDAIGGPLCWLGLFEVDESGAYARLSPLGAHVLAGADAPPEPPAAPIVVQSTYEVLAPPGVPSFARFQLARVAERQAGVGPVERYRLTRRALLAAIERGVSVDDVLAFLEQHAAGPLPPAVVYSLREWGGKAEQVRVEHAVLLRADDPVVMAQLRAGKWGDLGDAEALGPAVLRMGDGVADALVERLRAADIGVRDERVDPGTPIGERDLRAVVAAAAVYVRICEALGWECEVSPAMLQRLLRLVPPRAAEAALRSAERAASGLAAIRKDDPP